MRNILRNGSSNLNHTMPQRPLGWLVWLFLRIVASAYHLHAGLREAMAAPVSPERWAAVQKLGLCSPADIPSVATVLDHAFCAFLIGASAFGHYCLVHWLPTLIMLWTVGELILIVARPKH